MPLRPILYISLGEGATGYDVVCTGLENDAIPAQMRSGQYASTPISFPFTFSEVFGALLYTRTSAIR